MDKKFITNLQGKEFVLFEGLLNEFHENGGKEINTEESEKSTPEMPKFKATVSGEKGTFTGHGDANDDNVNRLIAKHKYRMAETRAIARALRWYNNIGMCSKDELGGDDITPKSPQNAPQRQETPKYVPTPQTRPTPVNSQGLGTCEKCGAPNKLSNKTGNPYCSALCWNN